MARLRYPDCAIHPVMRPTVPEMGEVAERIAAKAGSVIAARDIEAALALEHDDDEMDRLHRDIFTMLMDGKRTYGTEAAVDATLVGPYYERFAGHAVLVARGLVYLVTGEFSAKPTWTTRNCNPVLCSGWVDSRPRAVETAGLAAPHPTQAAQPMVRCEQGSGRVTRP